MELADLKKTQPFLAKEILDAHRGGFLPQSLLFMGPRGSSRLTAALDLAFLLMDDEVGRVSLSTPNIVYFPHREFASRLRAAITMFERERTYSSRRFLLETVRLVLFQYHSSQANYAPAAAKGNFSTAADIDNALASFEEDRDYSDKEIKELVSLLNQKCLDPKFLYFGKRGPSPVSIDCVRGMEEWFSSGNEEKIVIIEDIEDATDGARNSLLKTLEEPPIHSHIILISANPQKIMETILSRVRKFSFPQLSQKTVSTLIGERFRTSGEYNSFDAFFFQKGAGEEARAELEKDVQLFVNSILGGKMLSMEEEDSFLNSLDKLSATRYFRERVSEELEAAVLSGRSGAGKVKRVLNLLNAWVLSSEVYNMSDKSSFDLILREAQFVK